jgi:hypothetical protein
MGIFTSLKRHALQAAQIRLIQAQANADRLRLFLPNIAAGLGDEGYRYAPRGVGVLVAIAGWPSLVQFIYELGSVECDLARLTDGDEGERLDHAVATTGMHLLLKTFAEPLSLDDVADLKTFACILMVWWGLSGLAEPQHPIPRLIRHFGGHPFKTDNLQEVGRCLQIRGRITPEADKLWKQAERKLSHWTLNSIKRGQVASDLRLVDAGRRPRVRG